ncbi:MAG: hypothetical protein QHH06_14480 [Clostridiales bacterium]|jgi:hypothetical protein|nr:hypothetical protein [Eubacteriales bacterium]MDH7567650.1 hypothetical protein [Clostridiales bacterium]
MKLLNEKLNNFFKLIGLSYFNSSEDTNVVVFRKQIDKDECMKVAGYDYSDIFNFLDTAFKIVISHQNSVSSIFIKKEGYNKEAIKEDIDDLVFVYDIVDIEVTIDKSKIVEKIKASYSEFRNFNIIIYSTVKRLVDVIKSFSFNEIECSLLKPELKNLFIILNDNIVLENGLTFIIGGKSLNEIREWIVSNTSVMVDWRRLLEIIESRNENCNWIGGTKWLLPEYLFFDFDQDRYLFSEDLKNALLKKITDLVIPFFADYSISEHGDTLSTINGYKKIVIKYKSNLDYEFKQVKYLYKIYQWVYSDGSSSDKISILRNLSTIFLCEECNIDHYGLLLKKSYDIYKSVLANFNIYLKENVEQYLNERRKIRDIFSNKAKEISNEINSILETLNKNLLTSVGVVVATMIGYATKASINILKISAVIYIIFLTISGLYYLSYNKLRLNIILKDYNQLIESFKQILIKEDIPDDTIIRKSKRNFYIYWGVSIFINICMIIAAIAILTNIKLVADFLDKIK